MTHDNSYLKLLMGFYIRVKLRNTPSIHHLEIFAASTLKQTAADRTAEVQ